MNNIVKVAAILAVMSMGLSGCSGGTVDSVSAAEGDKGSANSLPSMIAYRSPSCGCCELWVEHMRAAGFEVDIQVVNNMSTIKTNAGIPVGKGSCHTARVGDYVVEGHVPAADIKRLLAERPDARGLVVPGMVAGSPGMEQSGRSDPYEVLLIANDGSTSVYSSYGR